MPISKRINKIHSSRTMQIAAKALELKSAGENVIDLSVGEPDFPTPANIKEAAIRAIRKNKTRYTFNAGTMELREAIRRKLKEENGLEYTTDEIIVSTGAKQSIFNAVQSIVYVNDEVIIPAPYWVSYPEMVTLAHGNPVIVDTLPGNKFKITPEQLKNAATPNTKAFILCNPSNPTGETYTEDELKALTEVCEDSDFYIIADEIYEKLIYDDVKFVSFASLSKRIKKRTILINGVSKAYSMTGWRVGYAAGPQDVIAAINKIQSHSTSNASSISQAAAVEALTGDQAEIEKMRKAFCERRNYIWNELNSIEGIRCGKPTGAFYLFADIAEFFGRSDGERRIESSFDFAMYLLETERVAVVPGSSFGTEGFLRISYATSMKNLKEAVKRIRNSVSRLQSNP